MGRVCRFGVYIRLLHEDPGSRGELLLGLDMFGPLCGISATNRLTFRV